MTMRRKNARLPLHARVAETLRRELLGRSAGEKLESETRLAERLGVSFVTVREALAKLAQEGLIERRHGSGTYVAERQAQSHVGVLIDLDISGPHTSPFFLQIVNLIRHYLTLQGLRSQLYVGNSKPEMRQARIPTQPSCAEFWDDLAQGRIRGVIANGGAPQSDWTVLRKSRVPWVGQGSDFEVDIDQPGLVRESIRILAEAGRKKVALFGWKEDLDHPAMLRQQGLSVRSEWMRQKSDFKFPGSGWNEFVAVWSSSKEKPDGLIVCDDVLFEDVMKAILALDIDVPSELMVISHANKGLGSPPPFPMLHMEFDPDEFARTQVELLVAQLKGGNVRKTNVILPFRRVSVEGLVLESGHRRRSSIAAAAVADRALVRTASARRVR